MNLTPAARAAILFAAGGLAIAAVHQSVELSHQRQELVGTALDLKVDDPGLLQLLERAEDPEETRALLARGVLVTALAESEAGGNGASGVALRDRRLDAAERLARTALARRPASWRAAMVAGAAPYLRWSLDRDPRLLQEYRRWEEPLALAERLAPGQHEPVRYLASAYVELWPALSDAKKERARALMARAFEEPSTFAGLLDIWLDVSGSDLRPIPDTPRAWTGLQDALARRREWRSYCQAWSVRRQALRDRLTEAVADGERLLEAEQLLAARTALFEAAAAAPVDRDFAALVDRALHAAPYGPGRTHLATPLAAWLDWGLDLDLLATAESLRKSGKPPLSPETLARLRAVVTSHGDPPDHRAAAVWTYLVAGDWSGAERAERQSAGLWSDSWAPYWIVKARRQIARGEIGGARRSLAEVGPAWHGHPAFRLLRRSLLAAEGNPEVDLAQDAKGGKDAEDGESWGREEWTWRGTRARLDLLVGRPAAGLDIALADVPADGAAIALRWDGEVIGCQAPTGSGLGAIGIDRPISTGLHLLEIETLGASSGRVAPGAVRLTYDDSPGSP